MSKGTNEHLGSSDGSSGSLVEALSMLRRHQWAGVAHGSYGSSARKCPECGGLHPDDALNAGGGQYILGDGHKPDCQLAAVIGSDSSKNYGSNAGICCDTDDGPCACGAWH